tara:strand:+ start:546 stop:1145 length:600 start_codon:yes stop_codon:yes gene_type:complete
MKLKKANILSPEHFIGSWYIPKKVCDDLINFHKRNHELGNTNQGAIKREAQPVSIDRDIKESTDLQISSTNEEPEVFAYRNSLQRCLEDYVKTYPSIQGLSRFNICEDINIQYYKKGGGYKNWHMERSGSQTIKRCLVFMTYLNDVKDGGTEFKYQKFISPAKKGLTLIWPPDWTHSHKSQVSFSKDKYIITGWYSFLK